jgi:hypothetical protein
MDLNKIFEAAASNKLTAYDSLSSQPLHPGEKGAHRERILSSFLSEYLPTRYSVSSGQIMDSVGTISRQCDIVIFDSSKCPLLFSSEEVRVFPCEPVLAAIEVKSSLSPSGLADAILNIGSIKRLHRPAGPIGGVVFSYRSTWHKSPVVQLAERLQQANADISPNEYVDIACILDAGIAALSSSEGLARIPSNPDDREILAYLELDKPILFWFFVLLLDLLDGQKSEAPDYGLYSRGLQIGTVRIYDVRPERPA